MTPLAIKPMPTPGVACKGWLCLMATKYPEREKWRDGLCPECLDEIARQEIRDEQAQRRYEP